MTQSQGIQACTKQGGKTQMMQEFNKHQRATINQDEGITGSTFLAISKHILTHETVFL